MRKIKTRQAYFNTTFKTRNEDDGKKYIEGYFIRYNEETELWEDTFEEVSPGAVTKSLKENDVRALFNHNSELVLGRAGNNTVTFKDDEIGLWASIEINENDQTALDVYARVERGDINACSFGFRHPKEEVENREDGTTKFILKEVDLLEISAVTFPAYPTTSIEARKKDIEQHEKRKLQIKKDELRKRLKNA